MLLIYFTILYFMKFSNIITFMKNNIIYAFLLPWENKIIYHNS